MATSLPSSPLPSSITVRGNDGMVIFEWLAASSINASPETFRSLGVQGSMSRYVKDEFLMESSASGDIVGGSRWRMSSARGGKSQAC